MGGGAIGLGKFSKKSDTYFGLGSGERKLIQLLIRFLFMQSFAQKDLKQRTFFCNRQKTFGYW